MICPNCGKEASNANFCTECGFKFPVEAQETPVNAEAEAIQADAVQTDVTQDAPVANENVNADDSTVSEYTAPAAEQYSESVPFGYEPAADVPAPKKKKKGLIIGIIVGVVVLALAAAAVFFFMFMDKAEETVSKSMYIKDNAAYLIVDSKDEQSILIADNIFKEDDDVDAVWYMNCFEFVNKDKKVYYPQKIDIKEGTFSLYYKMMNKLEEDGVKLAEDVSIYTASEDGKLIVYSDSMGNLYLHDMTERKKLASEVSDFWVSDDFLTFAYSTEEGDLYVQVFEGDKNKIDSDITDIQYVSADLKDFRYMKEDALYIKKADAEKIKVDTEIDEVVYAESNGCIYYTKSEEQEEKTGTLYDFVTDPEDLIAADDALDYYSSNYKVWNERLYREWSREGLKGIDASFDSSVLYYYNGESSVVVNKSFASTYSTSADGELIIKSYDSVNVKEVSIKDFVDSVDAQEHFRENLEKLNITIKKTDFLNYDFFDEFHKMIEGAYETDATVYYVKDGKTVAIENEKGTSFRIGDAGTVYYLEVKDEEKDLADIHVVKLENGAVVSNEVYDTDVSTYRFAPNSSAGVLYVKEYKDDTFDLYLNKTLVEYDVSGYWVKSDKELIYYTDEDEETGFSTVYYYKDGEKTKIADDAYGPGMGAFDSVYYYLDYSKENSKGDYYRFNGVESERIDYDVALDFNVYFDKYRTFEAYVYEDIEFDFEDYDFSF